MLLVDFAGNMERNSASSLACLPSRVVVIQRDSWGMFSRSGPAVGSNLAFLTVETLPLVMITRHGLHSVVVQDAIARRAPFPRARELGLRLYFVIFFFA